MGFVEGAGEGVEVGLELVGVGVFGEEIGGVGVCPALHEFVEHEGEAAVGEILGGRGQDEDADGVFFVGVFGEHEALEGALECCFVEVEG